MKKHLSGVVDHGENDQHVEKSSKVRDLAVLDGDERLPVPSHELGGQGVSTSGLAIVDFKGRLKGLPIEVLNFGDGSLCRDDRNGREVALRVKSRLQTERPEFGQNTPLFGHAKL